MSMPPSCSLRQIAISMHCWQGDDVGGFERSNRISAAASPSRATIPARPARRTNCAPIWTRRSSLIPGTHRLNLHASYAETGGQPVERNRARAAAFSRLDRLGASNEAWAWTSTPPTSAHPKADDGFTLAHPRSRHPPFLDRARHRLPADRRGHGRKRWARPCVTNVWIPDGMKDTPADRQGPATAAGRIAGRDLRRADRSAAQSGRRRVQAVRHRIGELRRRFARVLPGLRHHATEAALPGRGALPSHGGDLRQDFVRADCTCPRLLLHVSRGVRWDSDHVVTLTDELQAIAQELVRGDLPRARPHRVSTSSTPASIASPPG